MHRILIVEDDEATRRGLETLLTEAGYQVTSAATVPAGLRALRSEPPDLLIADIRVDGYNGLQLAVDQKPPARAIFVTGYPDPVLEAEARQLGADYLIKPVNPRALLARVQERLGIPATLPAHNPVRRWKRTALPEQIAARIAASNARIVDVSYGGMRIALDGSDAETLPSSFSMDVPVAPTSVNVDLVWRRPDPSGLWMCGLAVAEPHQPVWREVIDRLAPSAA